MPPEHISSFGRQEAIVLDSILNVFNVVSECERSGLLPQSLTHWYQEIETQIKMEARFKSPIFIKAFGSVRGTDCASSSI